MQQIESNTHDLGQLQVKLDDWNRQGLDEREVLLRTKDEQLNGMSVLPHSLLCCLHSVRLHAFYFWQVLL